MSFFNESMANTRNTYKRMLEDNFIAHTSSPVQPTDNKQ